jgi:acyl carrier protein
MQTAEIEREIRKFLVDNFLFGHAEALNGNESPLGNVLDSTGMLELVVFLQDRFAVIVEDEEVLVPENFESLKGLVTFVAKKIQDKC